VFYGKSLAFAVGIDKRDGEHVILGIDAPKVAQSKWKLRGRDCDRSPNVDYLETTLQALWRFIRREVNGLINVSLKDRLSFIWAAVNRTGYVTANS
jgi:hypothetical protein